MTADLRDRVVRRLREMLGEQVDQRPGEPLVSLLGPGYDSMRRLQVLLALDEEFGIDRTPVASDLETVESIVRFVRGAVEDVA